jgi:hypothetical protein
MEIQQQMKERETLKKARQQANRKSDGFNYTITAVWKG